MNRRNENGAIAAMTAIMLVVVVGIAAFAVDLGMQRVVRSDMQALADVVALDAARLLDGRTAVEILAGSADYPPLGSVVADSVARNQDTLGTVDGVTPSLVYVVNGPNGEQVPRRDGTGALDVVADGDVPDAVYIVATGSVDFGFAPGSGSASRTALGRATPYACFRLGSFAAALNTGDSAVGDVFEAMVGDALGVNLNAVGYQGLLTSYIGIKDLAAQLGAGSPEELANLHNLSVASLLSASAQVLSSQGDSSGSAVLASIAAHVSSTLVLDMADILSVGNGAAMQGTINSIDLLGSAGFAASTVVSNQNNFLDTGVAWSEPHVSGGFVALQAIEAPKQACGAPGPTATASTAQVSLAATIGFSLPNKVVVSSSLGSLFAVDQDESTPSDIKLAATLAGAQGTLSGITCGAGTSATDYEETRARIDAQLLSTSVTLPFRLQGTLDVSTSTIVPSSVLNSLFPGLGTVTSVSLELNLKASVNGASYTAPRLATGETAYRVPPHNYQDAEPSYDSGDYASIPAASVVIDTAGSTATVTVTTKLLDVSTTQTATVSVSSLDLTSVVSAVTSSTIGTSTTAVVDNLNAALVPVSKLLGIRVNGADMIGVPRPNCSVPALVG